MWGWPAVQMLLSSDSIGLVHVLIVSENFKMAVEQKGQTGNDAIHWTNHSTHTYRQSESVRGTCRLGGGADKACLMSVCSSYHAPIRVLPPPPGVRTHEGGSRCSQAAAWAQRKQLPPCWSTFRSELLSPKRLSSRLLYRPHSFNEGLKRLERHWRRLWEHSSGERRGETGWDGERRGEESQSSQPRCFTYSETSRAVLSLGMFRFHARNSFKLHLTFLHLFFSGNISSCSHFWALITVWTKDLIWKTNIFGLMIKKRRGIFLLMSLHNFMATSSIWSDSCFQKELQSEFTVSFLIWFFLLFAIFIAVFICRLYQIRINKIKYLFNFFLLPSLSSSVSLLLLSSVVNSVLLFIINVIMIVIFRIITHLLLILVIFLIVCYFTFPYCVVLQVIFNYS